MGEQRNSSQRRLPGKRFGVNVKQNDISERNSKMIRVGAVSLVTKVGSNSQSEGLESVAEGLHNDLRAKGLSVDRSPMRLTGFLETQRGRSYV